ncbi:MAG: hypothetical protein E6G24_00130 [Actinobacteria bacterium]|nr:MAG: hypothetical protein E6G24_00130 [Actinomycetota bacterium]
MRRLLVIALAACAAIGFAPNRADAAQTCGIPDRGTLWIDFAGTVQYWQLFAKPGIIAATSNFIYPELLKSFGSKTIYWDMHFVRRVGTPLQPFDPSIVIDRANRMYDVASMSLGCSKPMIAENELNGANLITPWSATNAQYRRNVMIFVQTLAARGAHPVLLVPSEPYMGDVAGDWWRELAKYADIVRESYFSAPRIGRMGPFAGSRALRDIFRRRIASFTDAGIPVRKLGIMLGFHTTPGLGGRDRAPLGQWLEVTKLQTLAAKQVAKEVGLRSVWSWGWGVWSVAEDDPDKPLAACVYLWTRNPKLCNGPKVAGKKFNTSRTEGQLVFPGGARCTLAGKRIDTSDIRALTSVTGDPNVAFTAVFARAVASLSAPVKPDRIAAAEKAVVGSRFGSFAGYRAALARAHASPAAARGVIADELRRALIEQHMRVPGPSGDDVQSFYETYAETNVRHVRTKSGVPWLGGRKDGFALASNAPPQLFSLPAGRWVTIRTMLGPVQVQALEPVVPLGAVPLSVARAAVVGALKSMARDRRYEAWLLARQRAEVEQALCRKDELPTPGIVPLTDFLPFLAVD